MDVEEVQETSDRIRRRNYRIVVPLLVVSLVIGGFGMADKLPEHYYIVQWILIAICLSILAWNSVQLRRIRPKGPKPW